MSYSMGTGAGSITLGGLHQLDSISIGDHNRHPFPGLDLRVTPANGGYVVSVNLKNNFSSEPELYIISEEKDLGAEIGKIITMSCLKKE